MSDVDKRSLQIIHIAGERDREMIDEAYKRAGVKAATFAFIDRIDEAYSVCDLAISRSGSAALFELAFYGKPMVLVPYPFAMNHQKKNAAVFEKEGAAFVCEEKDLTAEALRSLIDRVRRDPERRGAMSRCARSLSVPDAGERLAAIVRTIGTARKRSDAQN
jgi:UDP-N-acetylglucosamine--N-acetylmuramyl-(pentapeptide) pyrophosphoryl-undecaprenol N-acetylglucosamine transferase